MNMAITLARYACVTIGIELLDIFLMITSLVMCGCSGCLSARRLVLFSAVYYQLSI